MSKYIKWQVVVALLGFLGVASLLGPVAFSTSPKVVPAPGGTYVEGLVGAPRYLNPLLAGTNPVDRDLVSLVFSGLTKTDSTRGLVPDLAQRWTISADGKSYTFYLRPDARWHDGQPVTADDVLFTVAAMQAPDYQGPPELAELWRNVAVQKVDALTVCFTLQNRYAPFLEYTTLGLLPAHLLGEVPPKALPAHDFNAFPVGTGPFVVGQASLEKVVLEASPYHYGEKPFLQRLQFRFYRNESMAWEALRRGEVQGLGSHSWDPSSPPLPKGRFDLYSVPEISKTVLLIFNTKDALFQDQAVRQALALALDRRQLVSLGLRGQGVPAYGPVPSVSWAYAPEVEAYEGEQAQAGATLELAGWRDTDGDGIREKDSLPLRFTLLTNDRPEHIAAAQEVRDQWAAIGAQGEVQVVEWGAFVADFLVPRRFQVALTEQWAPSIDPDCYQFWHSSQIKEGLNFASWAHRQADQLLEKARQTMDQLERKELYREFQALFVTEWPGIPLYHPLYHLAIEKTVQGVQLGPLLEASDRFHSLSQWYVRTKRARWW